MGNQKATKKDQIHLQLDAELAGRLRDAVEQVIAASAIRPTRTSVIRYLLREGVDAELRRSRKRAAA